MAVQLMGANQGMVCFRPPGIWQPHRGGIGYRRHTDDFVLLRDEPSVYANNHLDGSWQTSVRHTVSVATSSALLFGLEFDGDSIQSIISVFMRATCAGYVDLDCAHPRAVGMFLPVCGKNCFRVACSKRSRRIWQAVCDWHIN